jgi:hypothetical protein
MIYDALRQKIGFKKTPMNPDDDGLAFMAFLNTARGNSLAGIQIRSGFAAAHDSSGETPQQTAAAFIDYLIVNYWGEEPVTDKQVAAMTSTPGANRNV